MRCPATVFTFAGGMVQISLGQNRAAAIASAQKENVFHKRETKNPACQFCDNTNDKRGLLDGNVS